MRLPDPKQLLNLQAQHENRPSKVSPIQVALSLDYGEKFCGLAVAPDGITVLPVGVVATADLNHQLKKNLQHYQAKVLVVGLPVSADGSENKVCQRIRQLAQGWSAQLGGVSVVLVNERFSSQATISPDKARVDDLAAMQILQFYLDKLEVSRCER